MCGIIGMAGEITRRHIDAFEDMLDVIQVRGRHSTGIVKVDRQGKTQWAKAVGTPNFLKDTHTYTDIIDRGSLPQVLIGHGRHKTVGELDWKSAHPFEVPESQIVGVHNGTLRGYMAWDEHKLGMTDSEALYRSVGSLGAEEAFARADGAYACVWWDGERGQLRIIRNKERPLYIAYDHDMRVMLWASEPWMFGAFSRKIALWSPKGEKYLEPIVDHLYSFEVSGNASKDKATTKMVEDRKITKKILPLVSTTGSTTSSPSSKGGEVTNPFQQGGLPQFLQQTAKTGEKLPTTSNSTSKSSTSSKSSSDQSKQSKPTPSSSKSQSSQHLLSLHHSPKTNRKKLSVVSGTKQSTGLNSQPDSDKIYAPNVGTDTRYINKIDMEFITDLRTGVEYSEVEIKKNTNGGKCCHCGIKVTSLREIAEIFTPDRFICHSCCESPRKPQLEVA